MILIGLTGGIGSGKSTVSELLRARGAVVVDGDAIARDLQVKGAPALGEISSEFGDVIRDDGSLDRQKLASIVFTDPSRLAVLNRIMLPKIHAEIERRITELRVSESVVVLDLPLLAENPRGDLDGVLVVDAPTEIAIRRLVEGRGMTEDDARARISRQASREERLKIADLVIDNSGTPEQLSALVDDAWRWITAGARSGSP